MTNISPFQAIFETKAYPHARTLRTRFSQKVVDAFYVLVGLDNPGIFDYLTLFIPKGIEYLWLWCFKRTIALLSDQSLTASNNQNTSDDTNKFKKILAWILLVPLSLINIPFYFARAIFGYTVSLLCLPIIAIVHFFSRLAAGNTLQTALNTQMKNEKQTTGTMLSDVLERHSISIDNITAVVEEIKVDQAAAPTSSNTNKNYKVTLYNATLSRNYDFGDQFNKPIGTIDLEFPPTKETTRALCELNMFKVVSEIEKIEMASKVP